MTFRVGDYGKDVSVVVNTSDVEGLSNLQSAKMIIKNGGKVFKKDCAILPESNKVSYRLEKGVVSAEGDIVFDVELKWGDSELKIEDRIFDVVK